MVIFPFPSHIFYLLVNFGSSAWKESFSKTFSWPLPIHPPSENGFAKFSRQRPSSLVFQRVTTFIDVSNKDHRCRASQSLQLREGFESHLSKLLVNFFFFLISGKTIKPKSIQRGRNVVIFPFPFHIFILLTNLRLTITAVEPHSLQLTDEFEPHMTKLLVMFS